MSSENGLDKWSGNSAEDTNRRHYQPECREKRAESAYDERRAHTDRIPRQAAEQRPDERCSEPKELSASVYSTKESPWRDRLPQADLIDLVEGGRAIAKVC